MCLNIVLLTALTVQMLSVVECRQQLPAPEQTSVRDRAPSRQQLLPADQLPTARDQLPIRPMNAPREEDGSSIPGSLEHPTGESGVGQRVPVQRNTQADQTNTGIVQPTLRTVVRPRGESAPQQPPEPIPDQVTGETIREIENTHSIGGAQAQLNIQTKENTLRADPLVQCANLEAILNQQTLQLTNLQAQITALGNSLTQVSDSSAVLTCEEGSSQLISGNDYRVAGTAFTSSSFINVTGLERIANHSRMELRAGGFFWQPLHSNSGEWIQVTFNQVYAVKFIETGGPHGQPMGASGFVYQYTLASRSTLEAPLVSYKDAQHITKEFLAPSPDVLRQQLVPPIIGRVLRLVILQCARTACRLNWEVYGCPYV